MQKKTFIVRILSIVVLVLSAGLSACSYLKFPGVYRIAVQQGNIIDQKKVDQLKVGMTKRQVQFVMGSPLLVDTFHEDRWDYIYEVRKADDILRKRRFTVYFEEDKLVRYEGDYEPNVDAPTDESYIEDAKQTEG
ncbi:outer membrane protein assembly factor BamE [Saccharophagus sp. K07]|uniref:outer membrane protein assembly factor BamE n=1 Tax=Saccharophagus sp. K07 TaxID=2283636 RepID=UPI001651DF9A|nr:outer membrane protein assembly factor BamE [Saccharophagus sp. K07]MBC6904226.1 outer membrane protein assembly factor BamE [Saccharophagus sp. K07]